MRVRIGSYWLAGDPTKTERQHSSALIQLAPVRIQQEQTGLLWAFRRHYDRGNAGWEISFDTTRLFTSYADVTAFIMAYHSAHAFQGTVYFRQDTGGSSYQEYQLYHAVIEPPLMDPRGVSLRLRYTIRGGELKIGLTDVTAGDHDILDEAGNTITDEAGTPIQSEY